MHPNLAMLKQFTNGSYELATYSPKTDSWELIPQLHIYLQIPPPPDTFISWSTMNWTSELPADALVVRGERVGRTEATEWEYAAFHSWYGTNVANPAFEIPASGEKRLAIIRELCK